MKDYSLGLDDDFILNYSVDYEADTITINYNNKSLIVPYTKDKEEEILIKMKRQLKFYSYNEAAIKGEKDFHMKYFRMEFLLLISNIILSCTGSYLSPFVAGFCGSCSYYLYLKALKQKNLLDDIKKNKLFLENEDKINEFLKLICLEEDLETNMLINREISLNINDIDGYTYEDVKELVMKANK